MRLNTNYLYKGFHTLLTYKMWVMFDCITFIPVVVLSAVFVALHFYLNGKFKYWQKLGIPYLEPTPVFGNIKNGLLQKVSIGEQLQQLYWECSDNPYVGIYFLYKPALLIRDLELVKNVLVKDSQNFIDRVLTLNEELDPLFGKSLVMITGQRWYHIRTNLNPLFSPLKIKKIFNLVDICGRELAECLESATVNGCPVDVTDIMYRYTTDVIASCAFGIDGHSLQDPQAEFNLKLRNIFEHSLHKGLAIFAIFFAPKIASTLKLKFLDDVNTNYIRRTVWSTVEYREKNGILRNDFLDSLMGLRKKGKEGFKENIDSDKTRRNEDTFKIDGDDFVAQAFIFLIAGFISTAFTLTCALYELSVHPEIQYRLRTEILSVLNRHNGELTYDGIQEMPYLDMVVSETLRKYPILLFLDRKCLSDYELPAPSGNGTVTLPAGTAVYIPVLALHHDPKYYPEPEKFDPDRFTEENKQSRPNYTYIPFGEGPRMCLGMRFALMEMKTALCHILSCFEVAPCKDTPGHIVYDPKGFELKVKGRLPLSFKRTNFCKKKNR